MLEVSVAMSFGLNALMTAFRYCEVHLQGSLAVHGQRLTARTLWRSPCPRLSLNVVSCMHELTCRAHGKVGMLIPLAGVFRFPISYRLDRFAILVGGFDDFPSIVHAASQSHCVLAFRECST